MFIHSVYFWLRPDLTSAERRKFNDGVQSLLGIRGVRSGYIGTPATTDRPVIDRSYSRALIIVFDDEAAHDAYQVDPVHDRFRNECGGLWSRVLIYDSITDRGN